jgi:RimJ/RimL family protein N-acetyltransferase
MRISLRKVTQKDLPFLLKIQKESFMPLLEKYDDRDLNPALDTIERLESRMKNSDTFFIVFKEEKIGALTLNSVDSETIRLNRLFVSPSFQGKGLAQEAMKEAERLHSTCMNWELMTIKEESKLQHLYEKFGYKKTGVEKKGTDTMTLVQYRKVGGACREE